jgi:hypothetical protein
MSARDMRAPSLPGLLRALTALGVGLAAATASGQPRPPQARSLGVDFSSIPEAPRLSFPAPDLLRQIKIKPYTEGRSLPAWRASRRGVLAVQLEARSPWAPVDADASGAQPASLPETCVPADYPWKSVPVRWGSLSRQGNELTLELLEARFDPRRCALGEARLSSAVAEPLLSFGDQPLAFAFRSTESLAVFLPREARVAVDTPVPRLFFGAFVRIDLPIKKGSSGSLIAAFSAPVSPAPARPAAPANPGPPTPPEPGSAGPPSFEISIEVQHLESEPEPHVFLFAKII